jgi:two-component system response regulator NreC
LKQYLESHAGLRVCGEASDGLEGIQKALELLPDLIVMDLAMPQMNGLEAARILKRKMPLVAIILFSLYAPNVSSENVEAAGISAVVSKTQPEKLVSNVAALLATRNQLASPSDA